MSADAEKEQPVVDIDAMIAEKADSDSKRRQPVKMRLRGREWTFKPIAETPVGLFDPAFTDAEGALFFVRHMLAQEEEPFPDDLTLEEAQTMVNAYGKFAERMAGLAEGESGASSTP